MNSTVMIRSMLAVVAVMSFAGCAGNTQLSAASMCASAGGTYSAQAQTCDTPAQTARKAADMCQAHNGYYDASAQVCQVGRGQ